MGRTFAGASGIQYTVDIYSDIQSSYTVYSIQYTIIATYTATAHKQKESTNFHNNLRIIGEGPFFFLLDEINALCYHAFFSKQAVVEAVVSAGSPSPLGRDRVSVPIGFFLGNGPGHNTAATVPF